jgi:hypothetical protein
MIEAKHARQKALSANQGKIQELLSKLAVQINRATELGNLSASISIHHLSSEQQNVVKDEIGKLGYTYSIDSWGGDYREPGSTTLVVKW